MENTKKGAEKMGRKTRARQESLERGEGERREINVSKNKRRERRKGEENMERRNRAEKERTEEGEGT